MWRDLRLWQGGGGHGGVEELREVGHLFDCGKVEFVPSAEIADVPPKVEVLAAAEDGIDFENEVDGGVW